MTMSNASDLWLISLSIDVSYVWLAPSVLQQTIINFTAASLIFALHVSMCRVCKQTNRALGNLKDFLRQLAQQRKN